MIYTGSRLVVLLIITHFAIPTALAEQTLLGRGQFGCVFSQKQHLSCCAPGALNCKNVHLREDVHYAVKLSNARPDLINEMKIAQILQHAESEENLETNYFFLGVEALCEVQPNADENIAQAITKCNSAKRIVNKDKKLTLSFLQQVENKLDYTTVKWAEVPTKKILEIWKHLFNGLALMHKSNILHLDIKGDNVLFDPRDLTHPKFIDFGEGQFLSDWATKNPRLLTVDIRDLIALISNENLLELVNYRAAFTLVEHEIAAIVHKTETDSTYDLHALVDKLYEEINKD